METPSASVTDNFDDFGLGLLLYLVCLVLKQKSKQARLPFSFCLYFTLYIVQINLG